MATFQEIFMVLIYLFLDIRNPFPNMNPQAQARTAPGGLNREEDAVADIIKLEDKSPPAPLNNAHQKFANVSSISNQVNSILVYIKKASYLILA